MKAGWSGARSTIEVPCTIDLEQTADSLHAYVDLDGVAPGPGDEVIIHDAPGTPSPSARSRWWPAAPRSSGPDRSAASGPTSRATSN